MSQNKESQITSALIELAIFLAAWAPKSDGQPVPYEKFRRMALYNYFYSSQPAASLPNFSRTNGKIRELIDLYRQASAEERAIVRRIIHQNGPKPIWVLLGGWRPTESDPAINLRLRLTKHAILRGTDDYRDETLDLIALYQEATSQGLDLKMLEADYKAMYVAFSNSQSG